MASFEALYRGLRVVVIGLALLGPSACTRDREPAIDPDSLRELEPFPPAEAGRVRHVFFLPAYGEEAEQVMRVELVGGKLLEVDCNLHFLGGVFVPTNLEGWGYTYYMYESEGRTSSTRMGCGGAPLETKLVLGESLMIDYNSRLPIVVYAPEGYVIRYRIFRGGELRGE